MNLTEITVELSKFLNVEPPEDSDDIENGKYLSDLEKYLQTFLYHYGKNLDDPKLSKELANIIKMKIINKKTENAQMEIDILRKISHPNILNVFVLIACSRSAIFVTIFSYSASLAFNSTNSFLWAFSAFSFSIPAVFSSYKFLIAR